MIHTGLQYALSYTDVDSVTISKPRQAQLYGLIMVLNLFWLCYEIHTMQYPEWKEAALSYVFAIASMTLFDRHIKYLP